MLWRVTCLWYQPSGAPSPLENICRYSCLCRSEISKYMLCECRCVLRILFQGHRAESLTELLQRAKRAAYPVPPPIIPVPESIAAQAAYQLSTVQYN